MWGQLQLLINVLLVVMVLFSSNAFADTLMSNDAKSVSREDIATKFFGISKGQITGICGACYDQHPKLPDGSTITVHVSGSNCLVDPWITGTITVTSQSDVHVNNQDIGTTYSTVDGIENGSGELDYYTIHYTPSKEDIENKVCLAISSKVYRGSANDKKWNLEDPTQGDLNTDWYKSLKAGEEITYVTAYATGIMLGDIASYAEIGEWKLPQEIAVSSAYTKTYNSGSFNLGVTIS